MRAEPSTCVIEGRLIGEVTGHVSSMNGEGWSKAKCSLALDSSTAGANGRKDSLIFTRALILSFISGCRGSARIDLLPKDRGPNSIRPCDQPMTFPAMI